MERRSRDSLQYIDSTDAKEKSPFLGGTTRYDHEDPSDEHRHHGSRRCCHRSFTYWPFILTVQLIFSIAIVVATVQRLASPPSAKTTNGHSLAPGPLLRPVVSYTINTSPKDWWEQPLYTDLSTESGMAWHDLMSKEPFRISREEMSQYNIPTSLWEDKELPSGGFPAVLGAYHNLHCVRHIKQELFNEYYFPGRTAEAALSRVEHTKHCLEVLRQTVMCNADLTPLPLLWSVEQNTSYVKPQMRRQCMEWESLVEGIRGREYLYDEIIPKDL